MMKNLLFSLFLGVCLILVGSAYAQDTGPVTPPEAPNLSLEIVSATEVNLIWEDNSDNETGFTVLRSLASDFSRDSVVTELPANTTTFNDTELSGNETYYYQVIAVNSEFAVPSNAVSNVACAPDLKFDTSIGSPVWTPYYTVHIGEQMELQGRIINKANCTPNYAAQPTYKVFLSEDNVLDADDINLSEVSFGDLKEGEGADLQSVTIPNDVTLVGAHFLIIQIDPAKLVYEREELNNTYSLPITISNEIDIKILNFSVNGVTDNKLDVTYDVANLSNGPVGGFEVSFSSTDNFIGTMHVDGIPIEDTVTVNGSIFIPCDGGGAEVIANLNTGSFVEPNTENNSDTVDFVYAYDPSLSNDLSVRDLVIDKSTVNVGESFTINSSARGDINGNNNITYFLSPDANLDGSDLQLGTSGVAPAVVCGNSDEDISQSLTIPLDAALGDYYVLAVIDYADDANEEFENNNIAYTSLVVTDDPDLVVSNVVVTNTPENMGTISVTFDITNQGLGPVGASNIGAYLSDDNSFTNAVAIITDNVISIPAIASGATYSGSATFEITSCDAVGEQFLFIKADKNNLIAEFIEENNTNASGVAVSIANVPDLEITHLAAPAATSGNSIIANITISNNAGTAQASTLRFYLSNNVNIGSSDIEIKSVAIDALACSETVVIEEELLLPEDLADGKYVMIAVIDAEDVVAEMDENNNIGFFVFNKGVSPLDPEVPTPICEAPTSLTVNDVAADSAVLSWDVVPGAMGYQLVVGGMGIVNSNIVSNGYTLKGLSPGTTYSWAIRTNCGESITSDWFYGPKLVTLGTSGCVPPTDLAVNDVAADSAVLSWDAVPGAMGYQLVISGMGIVSSNISSNGYTLKGLSPGTTYSWAIRTECGRGATSDWFYGPKLVTLGTSGCVPPTVLAVNDVAADSAVLSWDAVPGAMGYQLVVGGIGIVNSNISSNSYTLKGLSPGTTYSWAIRTNCGKSITSDWFYGPKLVTLGTSDCVPPAVLAVNDVAADSAVLSWDAVPGAMGYQLVVSGMGIVSSNMTSNGYTLKGLSPGTTYSWAIRTECGRGAISNWFYGPEFTTEAVMNGLSSDNKKGNTNLEWSKIKNDQVNEFHENNVVLSLYPNPSIDKVNILLSGDDTITAIKVMDMQGIIVKRIDGVSLRSKAISLREYGSGIFVVKVFTNNNLQIIRKVIIR